MNPESENGRTSVLVERDGRFAPPDELGALRRDVAELRGTISAVTLAMKQIEDAAQDYFDRGNRMRKAAQSDRKVVERLLRDNRCPACQQELASDDPA